MDKKYNKDHYKQDQLSNFGSPYNFVPLNSGVLIPWWTNLISQDSPLIDAESGTIELEITNLTPLHVKDGSGETCRSLTQDGKYIEYNYSAFVDSSEGKRYFIPGSSLRGMIRSVAEILSFSKLKIYNNRYFGFRDFGGNGTTDSNTYKNRMQEVYCGWLRKRFENEKVVYVIEPCEFYEPINLFHHPKFSKILVNQNMNAVQKHDLLEKTLGSRYPDLNGGKVVCTGHIKKKIYDYIFKGRTGETIFLTEDCIDQFLSIYKPSPYFEFLDNALHKGNEIPIFFIQDQDGKITNVGLTRNFRLPYKYSIQDCIHQELLDDNAFIEDIDNHPIIGHDMTDLMFGYVEKDDMLKGRVWIGNAFSNADIADNRLIHMSEILGEPQASFYPLYLKQNSKSAHYNSYEGKNGKPEIAGRKRYRVHEQSYLTKSPEDTKNEKVLSHFLLLPSNQKFRCSISFHNLLPEEIGLLFSAITLNGTAGAHHNLGLAKSFGYGKLDIKIVGIMGLEKSKEYYLEFFERYMNNFTIKDIHTAWSETPQLQSLMAIASDHNSNLEFMTLKEYTSAKKEINKNVVRLKENNVKVNSYIESDTPVIEKNSTLNEENFEGIELHNEIKRIIKNK